MPDMRTRTGILLIATVLFVSLASAALLMRRDTPEASRRETPIEERFAAATQLHNSGDYAGAVALYEGIIADYPERPDPYLRLGHTLRYWGKHDEAETAFLAAIQRAPENAWAWTDLGKLYRNMGRYEDAERTFFKSIELDPSREDTYSYGLGYLYLEMRRFEEAEAMFRKALELDPKSDMALSGLADTYREMGRYAESEEAFKKTFAVHPHSEAYVGLAWLYIKQERYADALKPLQDFLTHIREKGEVYYALGVAHEGLGENEEAIKAFERALSLNPDNEMFARMLEQARAR